MPNDIKRMPLDERARLYRAMAEEVLRSAETAQSAGARTDFLKLAHSWHMLATQIESGIAFHIDPDAIVENGSALHFRRPGRPS